MLLSASSVFRSPIEKAYQKIYSDENKQIKPRVDYSRFEIEKRQHGAGIRQRPQYSEAVVVQSPTRMKQKQQRQNAANGVWKTRGKFVYAE